MGGRKRPTKAEMRATINSFLLSVDETERPEWADAMTPAIGSRKDRENHTATFGRYVAASDEPKGPVDGGAATDAADVDGARIPLPGMSGSSAKS